MNLIQIYKNTKRTQEGSFIKKVDYVSFEVKKISRHIFPLWSIYFCFVQKIETFIV